MSQFKKFFRCLFLSVVLTSTVSAEPSFRVKGGENPVYPWHIWMMNVAYSEKYEWSSFLEEVMRLNNFASEEAFHFLPAGTELKIPYLPGEEPRVDEQAVRREVKRELEKDFAATHFALTARIKNLEAELSKAKEAAKPDTQKTPIGKGWIVLGTLLLILLLLGMGAFLFLWHRRKNAELEARASEIGALSSNIEVLQSRIRRLEGELESQRYFLDFYTIPFNLPADIGTLRGSNVVRVLRSGDQVEGESAVLVFSSGSFIKIKEKNLKRFFDEAAKKYDTGDTSTLDYYEIKRAPLSTGAHRTPKAVSVA